MSGNQSVLLVFKNVSLRQPLAKLTAKRSALIYLVMMIVVAMRHDAFYFCHRDHRQEPAEQREQSKEQTEATNQHHDVDRRRMEIGPA